MNINQGLYQNTNIQCKLKYTSLKLSITISDPISILVSFLQKMHVNLSQIKNNLVLNQILLLILQKEACQPACVKSLHLRANDQVS